MSKKSKENVVVFDAAEGDIFDDPDALSVDQDYLSQAGIKNEITHIPIAKPHWQKFFRTHPDDSYHRTVNLYSDQINKQDYLVVPKLSFELAEITLRRTLFYIVTRQSEVMLMPVGVHEPLEEWNSYHATAYKAALMAKTEWVRMKADQSAQMYRISTAPSSLEEPEWPDLTLSEVLRIAFKDRVIESIEHPVLKALRGEI